jgi:hypothetical protein
MLVDPSLDILQVDEDDITMIRRHDSLPDWLQWCEIGAGSLLALLTVGALLFGLLVAVAR